MYTHDEIEYKGYTIKIISDDDPVNPREWDNLGTMTCWHNRYNLGDETLHSDVDYWIAELADIDLDYDWSDDWKIKAQKTIEAKYFILTLYLYDHSSIIMRTSSFHDQWDSGQVGFIYVSKDAIRKEWNVKRISPKLKETVLKCLEGEVEIYDDYLTGNVWGYQIEDENEECLDSCWGFYGNEGIKEATSQGKGFVDWYINDLEEQAQKAKEDEIKALWVDFSKQEQRLFEMFGGV